MRARHKPAAPLLYLDANVLLPMHLRAVFLELAEAGLIQVHWGEEVLAEVRRNLIGRRIGLTPAAADKQIAQMAEAFPHAVVPNMPASVRAFEGKADPKDVHVAAGALSLSWSKPDQGIVSLVTRNIRHLPAAAFSGTRVRSVQPDQVLNERLAAEPRMPKVLEALAKRFRAPSLSKPEMLAILERNGCDKFALALGRTWACDPTR